MRDSIISLPITDKLYLQIYFATLVSVVTPVMRDKLVKKTTITSSPVELSFKFRTLNLDRAHNYYLK